MFQVTTKNLYNLKKDEEGKIDYSDDFFGKQTSLTVSGQLEGELAAMALGKIYTFGPTFRAENSNTPRHLAEFWMIEPEVAFIQKEELMDLEEDFIKYCVRWALEKCQDDLQFLNQFVDKGLIARLQEVCLSVTYNAPLNTFQFSYGTSKDNLTPYGNTFSLRSGFWKGCRVGLYTYNTEREGGTAHFDWFDYPIVQ